MPTPATKTLDPELKTALDSLRTAIAGAAPAAKLQALQAQVDGLVIITQVCDIPREFIGQAP